jgi:hypothetical protein
MHDFSILYISSFVTVPSSSMKTFFIISLLHLVSGSSASLVTEPEVSQDSILTARLAIHASDSGAESWILDTDPNQLVQEYNTATESTHNLNAVKDLFKLTVYSIMCRKAMTLMKWSECPELNAERPEVRLLLSALYEMVRLVFPDSRRSINRLVNIVVPPPPIPLPRGPPPASGSLDPSLLTPLRHDES